MLDLYHAEPVANSMKFLNLIEHAQKTALSMPNKVPEVLRTFGG